MTLSELKEKIANVPPKYWLMGGAVVLLLFLIIRKKKQTSDSAGANTDSLSAAMSLPGGIMYAPISSGVSGGTGMNGGDFSYPLPGDTLAGLTGSNVATPVSGAVPSAANSYTYTASAQPFDPHPYVAPKTGDVLPTSIWLPDGTQVTHDQIDSFFSTHPFNNQTQVKSIYDYGASLGLTTEDVSRAFAIYAVDTSVGAPKAGGGNSTPYNPANSTVTNSTSTATVTTSTPAAPASTTGSNSGISLAQIKDYWNTNSNNPSQIAWAVRNYGISQDQIRAAGISDSEYNLKMSGGFA